MELRPVTLPLGDDRTIRAVLGVPRSTTMDAILVLAHGANNNMDAPLIAGLHEKLARAGLVTVRFNFPYAEEGRKRPDPDEALEGVYRLVLEYVADLEEFKGLELYLGGKSMGARLAAQLVAQEVGASGLIFLGYPCIPPASRSTCGISRYICCLAPPCSSRAAGTPSAVWTCWGRSWAACR